MNVGIGLSVSNFLRVPTVPLDPDQVIADLFDAGGGTFYEGAWYDPSDLTTLYQDAAGTTPVTGTGQPVGLMLDKSKGGVSATELVTNGTFDVDEADTSDWDTSGLASTGESVGGVFRVTTLVSNGRQMSSISLVAGKTYIITSKARKVSGTGTALIGVSYASGSTFIPFPQTTSSSFVDLTQIFTATSNGGHVVAGASANGNGVYEFDNISIRELPGNHATQSTSTARPTLQTSGGLYYLDFDGVDDYITTTFTSAQAQPNTLALGYKYDDAAQLGTLIDSPGANRHAFYTETGNTKYYAGLAPIIKGTTTVDEVAIVHFNTTSSSARINGVDYGTANVGANAWGGIRMGANTTPVRWTDARLYSLVGVNRTLTAGEIASLETYLATKSGVTLP